MDLVVVIKSRGKRFQQDVTVEQLEALADGLEDPADIAYAKRWIAYLKGKKEAEDALGGEVNLKRIAAIFKAFRVEIKSEKKLRRFQNMWIRFAAEYIGTFGYMPGAAALNDNIQITRNSVRDYPIWAALMEIPLEIHVTVGSNRYWKVGLAMPHVHVLCRSEGMFNNMSNSVALVITDTDTVLTELIPEQLGFKPNQVAKVNVLQKIPELRGINMTDKTDEQIQSLDILHFGQQQQYISDQGKLHVTFLEFGLVNALPLAERDDWDTMYAPGQPLDVFTNKTWVIVPQTYKNNCSEALFVKTFRSVSLPRLLFSVAFCKTTVVGLYVYWDKYEQEAIERRTKLLKM